jgi:hypothetical protein
MLTGRSARLTPEPEEVSAAQHRLTGRAMIASKIMRGKKDLNMWLMQHLSDRRSGQAGRRHRLMPFAKKPYITDRGLSIRGLRACPGSVSEPGTED